MVRPDRDTFCALARQGRAIPLIHEVLADLDTPLAIFLKVDDGVSGFLFESVEGGERWGRFSFIGVGARATFTPGAAYSSSVARVSPNRRTVRPSRKPSPVTRTVVPPRSGPAGGSTAVIRGTGTYS